MTISSEESKASSGHIVYTAKQDHCAVLEKLVRPLEIVIVTGAAHGIGAAVAARCHLVNNHFTRRSALTAARDREAYVLRKFRAPAGSWVFAASQTGDKRE
jgi:hypothetical protein